MKGKLVLEALVVCTTLYCMAIVLSVKLICGNYYLRMKLEQHIFFYNTLTHNAMYT